MYRSSFDRPRTQDSFQSSTRKPVKPFSIQNKVTHNVRDNIIIDGKMIQQKRERCEPTNKQLTLLPPAEKHESLTSFRGSQNVKRFNFTVQMALTQDSTCIWKINLGVPLYGNLKRFITFKQVEFILGQWTNDSFPLNLELCCDQFPGYFDAVGKQKDALVVLDILEISSVVQNSTTIHDIKYGIDKKVEWEIPSQITQLVFRLVENGNNLQLPLMNPLKLHFQIKQQ